ncbi:pyridoxamine 5'-phosphate oxidase family protein [Glycomyces sp. NPDC046736]|uniref:pyridoxamine 5'-phosphate oxidase family protein n=1 Tax=Glycomyces sp. NPDC046736 TaxID=3155615 RepID=UPI0033C806EC
MFHRGERDVQLKAGFDIDSWGSPGVDAAVPAVAATFLAQQRLVVFGADDEDGAVWATALSGPAGFVTAADERTLLTDRVPDEGDPLAGRFADRRDLGMLAIEPATRRRMRVNGRARDTGAGLEIHTEQVYANCPKYLQTRTVEDAPETTPRHVHKGRTLTAGQRRWIAEADTFFVATRAQGLGADVSHRGGNPGFVAVQEDSTLTWPDYNGNAMFMTLGNLELDPRCGLLFLDWDTGAALHLTGTARTDWDPARTEPFPGALRVIDFQVEQAVQIDGAHALRWSFKQYSKFNPA